jgi:hypothetical protein
MQNNNLSEREKQYARVKSLTNYVFGIFIIAVGVVFWVQPKSLEHIFKNYASGNLKLLAATCFVYGIFRIYRGYAKNYFN